jgi:hypothetical protein
LRIGHNFHGAQRDGETVTDLLLVAVKDQRLRAFPRLLIGRRLDSALADRSLPDHECRLNFNLAGPLRVAVV